ncbi:MAG: hypothetical protein JXQ65_03840 [Candidatus Marinimicrobia bacterium]|nr:hypothetical protein [Candidatus Neomarinimicrobiota bacterium]
MTHLQYFNSFILLFAFLFVTACEDNPASHNDHDHHFQAIGLHIMNSGDTIASYIGGNVLGSINVNVEDMTPLLSVKFIAEDGEIGIPEGEEYGFDWEIDNSDIAEVHTHDDELDEYRFHVRGLRVGETKIKLIINHNNHKDFESKAIPIIVTE